MDLITPQLTEKLLTLLGTKIVRMLTRRVKASEEPETTLDEEAVTRHLTEVRNWCTRIQFFGLSKAHMTDRQSVALHFYQTPRRFRGKDDDRERRSERELLKEPAHHLVLGDPGSGKTTTLKRLAYHLLTKETRRGEIAYSFPIVVLCRELTHKDSLVAHIARSLGIPVRSTPSKHPGDEPLLTVGSSPLIHFLSDTLNHLRPLILIDGVDEAPSDVVGSLFLEIAAFAKGLDSVKLIVTCRSGLYKEHLEGFDLLEILPLDFKQIESIAQIWLVEPKAFYRAINDLPYSDVLDRPLLLTQLLFLFKHHGYLPRQPTSVYRRVIQLLLEDWDAERGVKRRSAYAYFEPDRKIDFLSELSFILTVKIKSKAFTRSQFLRAYERLALSFALPHKEGDIVAAEIESHTGLIVRAGFDSYEFAHLSLQEYLCANYIVRAPYDRAADYMHSYPAPIAVSVALSSDPGHFLCALLGQREQRVLFANDWASTAFFKRLILERPCFRPSRTLGIAFLRLLFDENLADEGYFPGALQLPGVRESLEAALSLYWIGEEDSRGEEKYYFLLKHGVEESEMLEPPTAFWANKEAIRNFVTETGMQLFVLNREGEHHEFRSSSNPRRTRERKR